MRKILAALGVVSTVMLVAIGSVSTSLCACTDAALNFALLVGAHPLKSDPAEVRTKLLAKLPAGSSQEKIREHIVAISPSAGKDPCTRDVVRMSCRFPVRETFWGTSGFDVRIALDTAGHLADAEIARF